MNVDLFSNEQQIRERLAGSLRYAISQRLVPKKDGGRLLATELIGSNLRTRETNVMGETETRRLWDIIEAGSTQGWHSLEQSLLKAFEEDLITGETALWYSVNKSQMHPRVDAIKKRQACGPAPGELKLKMNEPPKPSPRPKPPVPAGVMAST
jgi:twitching motility protein PilT